MDAGEAVTSVAVWNAALLETLLPVGGSAGQAVLLACDDHAVVSAASHDIPEDRAVDAFIDALRGDYQITTPRGLTSAARQITPYLSQPTPRPGPPPFLAALCVTVLAASRMNRDERLSTRAYYQRLCDLLGIDPLDGSQPVAGFKDLVQRGMRLLASWLEHDEAGRRGLLLLPEQPKPVRVGIPISQTLLRGRDRELLGAFFAAHEQHLRAGYDPVLLLRRWSGHKRLTNHAQGVLVDPKLHEPLAAAIRTAVSGWDGTLTDRAGRRVFPGALRLSAANGQIGLRLAVPSLSESITATTRSGQTVNLRAYPDAAGLPHQLLDEARDEPVRLTLQGRHADVQAIPSQTILFTLCAGGLEQIPAVADEPVWVLTCDPALLNTVPDGPRRFRAPLPAGWALLVDVTPDEMPEATRVSEQEGAPVRGATLAGGLPLGAGAWLLDHPPRVLCDISEPVPVIVDGHDHGYLEPGEPLQLNMLAGVPGPHFVEVDVYRLEFELRDRGLRAGIGSLVRHPQDQTLLRAGAVSVDSVAGGIGARVCGAQITGVPALEWRPPLLVIFNATVHVIYRDGRVRAFSPPEPPVWLEQVGLGHAVNRWEIPGGEDAVWLCVASDPHPRVLAHIDADVPATDEVLDVADWFAQEPVIGDDNARARWQRLVDLAAEVVEQEEGAGGA